MQPQPLALQARLRGLLDFFYSLRSWMFALGGRDLKIWRK
jgi:hypothetical protein